jgi:glyoxylase-like metal-dependent hydrolase (beta-lactamase superfamily II)/rhodanese-related sulfurtransferase
MNIPQEIDTATLSHWLATGEKVNVLDIRPEQERIEWFIPGSIHIDAYNKLKRNDISVFDNLHLDKSIPIVTVCTGGKTSRIAADILQQKGYKGFSLQNGMKGWSLAWNKATVPFTDYQIIQVRRTGKGCLSYIIISNNEAIVADASLPVEVYKNILKENNLQLKAVIETHIHADHLSRSKQLSEESGAKLLLPAPNKINFPYEALQNNQQIQLGKIFIKIISTPGHTIESICFLINDEVLLTGDTLFTNSIGRPDLKANNEEAGYRAGLLYGSLQLLVEMKDNIIVLPAHTNTPVDFDNKPVMATIGEIKNKVSMLKLSKEDFVETILLKLPPAPANFLTIAELNLKGDFTEINPIDLEAGANRCAVS